jgi:BNR repeat protein
MALVTVREGTIWRSEAGHRWQTCSGPRCAVLDSERFLCTFMVQSKMGINDLVPMSASTMNAGKTWSNARPIWPDLEYRWSIFCSISRARSGELFLFGIRIPIDAVGESFWSEATQGIKQDELFWAHSNDSGKSWSAQRPIPMPFPGSAEAPGPMCVTRGGRWIACYSPYNTFDPELAVARQQVVAIFSDDTGSTWRHSPMLTFSEKQSGGAEAWIAELADGRLLGAAWHTSFEVSVEYPNSYSLSLDQGSTWCPTAVTGILGQSVGLAALENGGALFVYNQRKHPPIGVWLAKVLPSVQNFGIQWNQPAWLAEHDTRVRGPADHLNWMNYSFGEPSVTAFPDGSWLVVFWCSTEAGAEIRYIQLFEDDSGP